MKKVFLFILSTSLHALAFQTPSTATLEEITDSTQSLQVHHNRLSPKQSTILESPSKRLEQSSNVTWCVENTNGNQFLCPKTSVCTSDYNFCPYVSTACNISSPFKCANGTCVANPALQCCPTVKGVAQVWCPHLNSCVNATNATKTCCSLNSSTPFYCSATKSCVSQSYQCCSQNSLVKCTFEDKCAPANSREYCFQPFNRSCSGDFSYQCPNDGTCKRSATDCSSPRVCPFGYTTCPDYSCLPGVNSIASCPKLPTCVIQGVTLARCSDGVTCSESFDKCPTQVTCPTGQVVCPDNTCATNQMKCVQPLQKALPPKVSTCGLNMMRCPDGECASDCNSRQAKQNCTQIGLIQCPGTFKCAASFDSCPSDIYCPLAKSYTHSSNAVLCSEGPNICTWDASRCKSQSCFNSLYYFNLISTSAFPWQNYNTFDLMSCPDGRCNPADSKCMTEISCSTEFIKGQTSGVYCHNSTTEADAVAELAYQLKTLVCPSNMIQCLSGHCRASVYDCPQTISCPSSTPIQCQDGQCVTNKQSCLTIDNLASRNLRNCVSKQMLLCQSDLKTCVTSQELCPTMSTCPMGYSKCAENLCLLKSQCPAQSSLCSSTTPFYCRSSGNCVQNQTLCFSLTTCPLSKPVKCASDQSCQQKVSQCPPFSSSVALVPTITNVQSSNITNGSTCPHYTCLDGSCSTKCAEWLKCPLSTDYQCPNGLCVTNSTQCSNSSNGCPFYLPFKCNFTAQCVSNTSQCASQTASNATLTSTCSALFGKSTKSCISGGCVSVNETCSNTTDTCNSYLFPNTINSTQCFVPQCPPSLPIKCENGLCVSEKKFCPVIPFQASQLNKCKSLSSLTGQNIPVPCGDGSCVARAELCPPLYNCSLNRNLPNSNNLTVRCNDGTCRSSLKQCPVLNQTCTFRCSNGMCVSSASQCLLDNGCPASAPNRCEQNGVCMSAGQSCNSIYQINQALSFSASKTSSICYSKLQVTCISGDLQYCAPNRANCINVDTGCNIFTPILCGGKCVQSVLKCTTGSTTALNNLGCGPSTPFRCSNLDIASCAALPYSQNASLAQNVCSAKTQSLIGTQPINKCTSSLTPVSCGDGSCVQNQGDCRTCNFFCAAMMQCTASATECTTYTSGKSTTFKNLDQQCPEGVPIRCIYDGQCVSSIVECQHPTTSIAKTFRSNLIDVTCPTNFPFRCITGKCVNSTVYCFSQSMMNSPQMQSPIQWNATRNQVNSPCQVFCADGSCRDRQQNCPLAQACLSPEAPFRCRQGVCAQNKSECALLFGVSELESPTGVSTYCYSIFGFNQSQQYFRCEDGTCRPAFFNNITNSYQNTCLQYFGCPLTSPYQCSTGQCVQSQSDCLTFSHSFCKGKQMCKNLACVDYLQQCTIDQSQISLIPFTADINPLQNNEIPFLVLNNQVVGTISVPSNAITGVQQSVTIAQTNYQRISFQPVLGQREMNSSVLQSSITYTQQLFKVTNSTISLVDSLLSPLVEISLLDSNQSIFTFNATLTAPVTLPTYFDLASDVCLAKRSQNGSMDCVSRSFSQQSMQSISMPIQGPGVYGLIFSPDISLKGSNPPLPFPTPSDDSGADQCNWYCQNKKLIMIIYISAGVVILFCIVGVIIFCCWKKWKHSKIAKTAVYQESLIDKKRKESQKVVNFEKTEQTVSHQTDEQYTQKLTLNDTNSDEEQRKRERMNEDRLRQKIEKKLKMQAEEELRKERLQFNQALEVKEQEIKNYKSAVKETDPIDKSSSPESRQVYSSAHYKEELKKRESQMREHFQEEVNRISRELLKQQEEAKNAPPRKFTRLSKDSSIKSYTTGSNYGSLPGQSSAPQLDNKNKNKKSDNELDDQWNVMMDEYSPSRGLQTQGNEKVSKPRSKQDNQRLEGSKKDGLSKPNNTLIEAEGYTRRGKTHDQNFKSPSRRLY